MSAAGGVYADDHLNAANIGRIDGTKRVAAPERITAQIMDQHVSMEGRTLMRPLVRFLRIL